MVVGILIGLVLGAAGAWFAVRWLYAARLSMLDDARGSLEATMKSLAADALRESNQSFLELAATRLGQKEQAVDNLVGPIKESLEKVGQKIQALETARAGAYASLTTQVDQLVEGHKALRDETGNLVSALRDRPNVRGRWGEIQLKRVVEMAGMLDHCDFETQAHVPTEDGRLRPDLVVKLPGGGVIVVDAKVACQAYMEALECSDDDARTAKLRDHARQVRDHVKKLSARSYWSQFERTPDFVVLFLGGENFLNAALEQDPALLEDGFTEKVLIATPTSLVGLLRTVAYAWRQETIAESAKEMGDLGRELYSRLSTMTTHFAKVGRAIESAAKSYNESVGSLETRVLPSARKFKDHGIAPAAELAEIKMVETAVRPVTAPELPPANADAA